MIFTLFEVAPVLYLLNRESILMAILGTSSASCMLSLSSVEYSVLTMSISEGSVFLSHCSATMFIMEIFIVSALVLTVLSTLA